MTAQKTPSKFKVSVDEAISDALKLHKIHYSLKSKQTECLKLLIDRKDVLAVLPTGYGKTLIYAVLPTTLDIIYGKTTKWHIVLVVSPLVSLMQDQAERFSMLGIDVVCATDGQLTKESIQKVKDGDCQVILMSPEALFGGRWRTLFSEGTYQEKIHTVVIDEAHCVTHWGTDFREDYSRLGELRSILQHANIIAMTATATKDTRKNITKSLCMETFSFVTTTIDRPNIHYQCAKASYSISETFTWLAEELLHKEKLSKKYIVYCRSIKACSQVYSFLMEKVHNDILPLEQPSIQNQLFLMYHHSTPERNKRFIEDNFTKSDSTLRIVIATVAFGMEVDVTDIFMVVHWGASRSFEGFNQESGRAGRSGEQAFSMVYFHPADIQESATDSAMRAYCKNIENKCRRQLIVKHFDSTLNTATLNKLTHNCCDICKKKCDCGQCPKDIQGRLLSENVQEAGQTQIDIREVSAEGRNIIKTGIVALRDSYSDVHSLVSCSIQTGLTDSIIDSIVTNLHHIHTAEDLLTEYIYDRKVATEIMQIIDASLC